MKPLYWIVVFVFCSCGSSLQPESIMQQWVGKHYSKLEKSWGSKVTVESWNNGGNVYTYSSTSFVVKSSQDKAKAKLDYVGPPKYDTTRFLIQRKFYVDEKQIIQKWEIVEASVQK